MTHTITIWAYKPNKAEFSRYDFDGRCEYNAAWRKYQSLCSTKSPLVDLNSFDKGNTTQECFGAHRRYSDGVQIWIKTTIQ